MKSVVRYKNSVLEKKYYYVPKIPTGNHYHPQQNCDNQSERNGEDCDN